MRPWSSGTFFSRFNRRLYRATRKGLCFERGGPRSRNKHYTHAFWHSGSRGGLNKCYCLSNKSYVPAAASLRHSGSCYVSLTDSVGCRTHVTCGSGTFYSTYTTTIHRRTCVSGYYKCRQGATVTICYKCVCHANTLGLYR